jgi:Ca-activated chloride channel family protein
LLLATLGTAETGLAKGWLDWWLTPDQQAQRLADQGQYAQAAGRYSTPERIGYAWFRAGDFERAAAAFGRSAGAEGAYNRGNALVMLGRYEEAIASYRRALELRPEWPAARENLELAKLRLQALAPPEDDAGGTGGQLGADEFVMDTTGRTERSSSSQVIEEFGQKFSEEALRALWLRRIETGPGEFLAAKFAAQLARQSTEQTND